MPLYATPPESGNAKMEFVRFQRNVFADYVVISKGVSKRVFNSKSAQTESKLECTPESFARDNVPILSVKISPDWKQTKRTAKWAYGGQAGYDYEFSPRLDSNSLRLFINWDGTIIQESQRAFWRDIFLKPPHDLSVGELEFLFKTMQLNFANSEAFKLTTAKTVEWNGRTVIQCEGDSIVEGAPERHLFAIAFDNYPEHSSAGVFGFSGSKLDFERNREDALKIVKSVVWK